MPKDEIRSRWLFRQIIANQEGLRWREKPGGQWQEAAWDSVTDFYLESPKGKNAALSTVSTVRFNDGRILSFSESWRDYRQLREYIARQSTNAVNPRLPDGTTNWILEGTRPTDLPASFAYSTEGILKARKDSDTKLIIHFVLAVALYVGLKAVPWIPAPLFHGIAGWFNLCVALGLAQRPTREKVCKEALRRAQAGERFEVTLDSLTVWQEGEKHTIPWSDVMGYDRPALLYPVSEEVIRIRTVTGKEFTFNLLLSGAEKFVHILGLYAKNAVAYRRGQNEKEALGGIKTRWTGGEEGKGDRVFHKRTRTHRQELWAGWIMTLIIVAGICWSPSPILPLWFLLPFLAFILFFSLLQTLRYFRDRITIGKEGIGIRRDGKETVLRWKDVTSLRLSPLEATVEGKDAVTQDTQTITFRPADYAYGSELPDLISEYVERVTSDAERAAVSASDVAQPEAQSRVWNQEASHDMEPQKVVRNR